MVHQIRNVYTINIQFNASLLNKVINFSKKNPTDTNIFNSTWIYNVCQPNCNIFATAFPVSLISDTCTSMMLCSSSTYSLSVSINSFIMWLLRKGKRKRFQNFGVERHFDGCACITWSTSDHVIKSASFRALADAEPACQIITNIQCSQQYNAYFRFQTFKYT